MYKKNSKVYWKWLGKKIQGLVVEKFTEPVSREIKGKVIKRNGSNENPAYLVQSDAGNFALKLGSELNPVDSGKKDVVKSRPKLFSDS